MRTLLDLILPSACAGCGQPGVGWCAACAATLTGPPIRVRPRLDPGVPCWALGPYRGPARRAVLAAKESGRTDLAAPIGRALAGALARLRADRPLVLVPAPSRGVAARRRGGDPVVAAAEIAVSWLPDSRMVSVLRVWWGVQDSVGLTPRERAHNLQDRVTTVPGSAALCRIAENAEVVVVDDVLTTGATVRESVRALARIGVPARAVLVTCAA
ncbi:ComF family protein [Nocardia vulneris]|uniref:Phosphoribosyltransferase n=1 Tax=Nocardia vulneris TaxID=1141657 RepID=A0ABR4ZCQ6_9NOCA|nr:ComF family protein [Nocardia vulneris]KIA63132.1 phosphoribosyltransferase [Nocardia vulneris]